MLALFASTRCERLSALSSLLGPNTYDRGARIYVRTRGSAADLRAPIRAVIRELNPRLPQPTVTTVSEAVAEEVGGVMQIASGVGAMGTIALLIAAATTTLLCSISFGLPPLDPVAFSGSAGIIMVVAVLATLAPAGRAARGNPVVALRAD